MNVGIDGDFVLKWDIVQLVYFGYWYDFCGQCLFWVDNDVVVVRFQLDDVKWIVQFVDVKVVVLIDGIVDYVVMLVQYIVVQIDNFVGIGCIGVQFFDYVGIIVIWYEVDVLIVGFVGDCQFEF